MPNKIPNVQLRAWRDSANMTRAEMADALNRTPAAGHDGFLCDEKRISKWESGEVLWPRAEYRRALHELTGRDAESLGFLPPHRRAERPPLLTGTVVPADALQAEAQMFDTLELARLAEMSDISTGTIEALQQAADLLCRAYPTTPAATLRDRTKRRLNQVVELLGSRTSLDQHRELLVIAGWMAALLGCVHYDLGEREEAEAARQAAYQWARQAGHGELMGWAFEMSAWFALVEGNYEQLIEFAQAGQQVAGVTNAGVQLTLQEAKGWSRLGDRKQTDQALTRGASLLAQLPIPEHRENHFVFDRTKYMFYAATCYVTLGDDARAEDHAQEVIAQHVRPDGTSNAPMRTAQTRIDLGIVAARRGDLDQAVAYGESAFEFERQSMSDLVSRSADLDRILRERYRGEQLTREFHERYIHARQLLNGHT
jgi:transcriptional regulator with XRE-family HTH domain